MALTKYKLGTLIKQRREKYDGSEELPIRGVAREGFISPKQDGADLSIYNVYYLNDFVFNPARMELNSIALNTFWDKAICSSLYEIFYIVRTDLLLPEYLNLFIKRDEFARKCWFEAVGSARNYFRVADLSEFDIELPDLPTQQKYVAIYNAMVANQQSYERGLEDLKLVCDGYIEDLRRRMPCEAIGAYIEQVDERNTHKLLDVSEVKSVNMDGTFAETVANVDPARIHTYKIVKPNEFAYTNRINIGSIARRLPEDGDCLVSASYDVFRITNAEKLMPEYLTLWIRRNEFFRSTGFYAVGSVKDSFSVDMMKMLEIPIPNIEIQKAIASIYSVYIKRKAINEQLKNQIKSICPILIRGSLEDGKNENI